MWDLDYKESWVQMNCCFWTVALEKTLDIPLDCKKMKPVNPKRKSVLNIHWKDWCWSFNTLAIWCEELTHLKRPWCWERLKGPMECSSPDSSIHGISQARILEWVVISFSRITSWPRDWTGEFYICRQTIAEPPGKPPGALGKVK